MEAVPQLLSHLRQEMGKIIVGQEEFRDQCLIALCAGDMPFWKECRESLKRW
jgi:hypothetical protein